MNTNLASPTLVGRDECEFLAIARALFVEGSLPAIHASLLLRRSLKTLGPRAMSVFEQMLAMGSMKTLLRLGGARLRVFDRAPAPNLHFGPYTFELVRWMTTESLGDATSAPFVTRPASIGDQLVAYLALRLLEGHRFADTLAAQPGVRASALAWLGFSTELAGEKGQAVDVPSVTALFDEGRVEKGRVVLECLSDDLRRRWIAASARAQHTLRAEAELARVTMEQRVLHDFVDHCAKAGRWDLATFLVDAGARLLPLRVNALHVAERAAANVELTAPLRVRTEARKNAGALFHALVRIGKKREELALVRFFDDGYDAAQVTVSAWDVLGRDGFARAEAVVRELANYPTLQEGSTP